MQNKERTISKKAYLLNLINSSKLFWIFSFTILTGIAAQITVPVKPVPFTLQTMMVVLSGAFLGKKNGALSQLAYLFLGIIGLPVFAQIPDATIGIARLLGPTGGYLLTFPFAAYLTGWVIEKNKNYINAVVSMFLGEIFILTLGSLYLGVFYLKDIKLAIIEGGVVFLIWTVVKVFVAAGIYSGITKKFSKKS
jgi:biotin transport system substrate-specific component